MLRIVVDGSTGASIRVTLEGQIIGPWVEELDRVCRPMLDGSAHVALDLSAVSFVSRDGIELLQRLRARRVHLDHCSVFVGEQIKAAARSLEGGATGQEPDA